MLHNPSFKVETNLFSYNASVLIIPFSYSLQNCFVCINNWLKECRTLEYKQTEKKFFFSQIKSVQIYLVINCYFVFHLYEYLIKESLVCFNSIPIAMLYVSFRWKNKRNKIHVNVYKQFKQVASALLDICLVHRLLQYCFVQKPVQIQLLILYFLFYKFSHLLSFKLQTSFCVY